MPVSSTAFYNQPFLGVTHMSLPAFSESAMNSYLSSIAGQPAAMQNFAADLASNFLSALSSRFAMDQASIDSVNAWPPHVKSSLQYAAQTAHRYSILPGVVLPIVISVEGFEDPGGQNAPADTVLIELEGKIKGAGTWPGGQIKVEAEVKVKASWYIC